MKQSMASRGQRIEKRTIESDRRVLSVFDAAEEGKVKELRRLLEDNPSNVYKTQEFGLASALHYAARAGHLECVEWLLDYKAPPNKQDQGSSTPLHLAAEHGHADIVKSLLDYGADKTITNYYRQGMMEFRDSPRDVAVYWKHPDIVEILDTYVPTPKKPGDKLKAWQEAEEARIAALEAEAEAARVAAEAAKAAKNGVPLPTPAAGSAPAPVATAPASQNGQQRKGPAPSNQGKGQAQNGAKQGGNKGRK